MRCSQVHPNAFDQPALFRWLLSVGSSTPELNQYSSPLLFRFEIVPAGPHFPPLPQSAASIASFDVSFDPRRLPSLLLISGFQIFFLSISRRCRSPPESPPHLPFCLPLFFPPLRPDSPTPFQLRRDRQQRLSGSETIDLILLPAGIPFPPVCSWYECAALLKQCLCATVSRTPFSRS